MKELKIYLEFNAEGSEVTNFRYGPNDEGWLPWCTLIATGYLLDCLEISAKIFGVIEDRWFVSLFKTRCERHRGMLDRYRDQLSADFKAGMD